ncbi:MAG TPA: ribonuclease P protein component [Aeromicrobium sp.]|nr:ribonuclease P protein component [Aeromicrobium sp.]
MRDSEDFSITVRRGQKAGRTSLVVHVLPDASRDAAATVGFVVSKAVGTAVERNRVKRRLRHLMRDQHVGRLPLGARVVVRALPAAAGASSDALAADLTDALRRAGAR